MMRVQQARFILRLWLALFVAMGLMTLAAADGIQNTSAPSVGQQQGISFPSGQPPLYSVDLTASNTLPAGISYSATSLRTVLDSNGFITYAPNNLLTQSNTFSNAVWTKNQISIGGTITGPNGWTATLLVPNTTPASRHSFSTGFTATTTTVEWAIVKGGGYNYVGLSSNPVNWVYFDLTNGNMSTLGTGVTSAGDMALGGGWYLVYIVLASNKQSTPNLDVVSTFIANGNTAPSYAGDGTDGVYFAGTGVSAITHETSPRPGDQVITTSSAYYGPAFDSNYPSAGYQGLRIWQTYTNVDLWNRDLTNVVWTASNITAAHNQTGIDNVANSASSLTATANNGTICQPITLASSARQQAIYVKRLTGTGAVSLSMDGGATYTALTVTASWGHQSIPAQTLANPQTCIKLATSGDSIAVDGVQNDNASAALAPVAFTTSSAVSVAADIVQATGTLAACLKANSMSAAYEFVFNAPLSTFPTVISNNTNSRLFAVLNSNPLYLSDGTNVIRTANSTTLGGVMRGAASIIGSNSGAISLNGGAVATGSGDSFTSGSTFYFGSKDGSSNFIDGPLRKTACWSPALPNSILQQKSVVGPGPITWNLPTSQNFLHASDTGSPILNSGDGSTPIMVN